MDKERSFKLLDAYCEAGGNFIDTANNYQNEQSEAWIGEWMESRKNRDTLVIADYKAYAVGKGRSANFGGNNRRSLHISVRDSLKKLKTDWIDILYVHWCDQMTSIEEMMDSLHVLVQQGKVSYLGVSDTPAWIVSAANYYAISNGKVPLSVYKAGSVECDDEVFFKGKSFQWLDTLYGFGAMGRLGGGKFQTKEAMEAREKGGGRLRSIGGPSEQTEQEVKISAALEKVAQ